MLIQENFPELLRWSLEILGTDLCGETIEKAKKATYSGFETARGLSNDLQRKYFDSQGSNWILRDDIRSKVQFKKMNLLESLSLTSRYDIIFLRNVLIYFDDNEKIKILKKVENYLQPDGILFLGTSETSLILNSNFKEEIVGITKIFRIKPISPLLGVRKESLD